MFLQLLENMELSSGFLNYEKRTHRTHMADVTLMPRRSTIKAIRAFGVELREVEGIGLGSQSLTDTRSPSPKR